MNNLNRLLLFLFKAIELLTLFSSIHNVFVILCHGERVIPISIFNYRSHDKKLRFLLKGRRNFCVKHFEYGGHFRNVIHNFVDELLNFVCHFRAIPTLH